MQIGFVVPSDLLPFYYNKPAVIGTWSNPAPLLSLPVPLKKIWRFTVHFPSLGSGE